MNKIKQQGFTFIELMSVLLIAGIIYSIAIPSYQDYILRAKLAEVFEISKPIKQAIADYYAYHGVMPKNNQSLFLAKAELLQGKTVRAMTVENGAIHITFDWSNQIQPNSNKADIISIRPVLVKSEFSGNIPLDYIFWLNGNCKLNDPKIMDVLGTNKTTLLEKNDKRLYQC
jgi:type IV pilus assembly protein PilA